MKHFESTPNITVPEKTDTIIVQFRKKKSNQMNSKVIHLYFYTLAFHIADLIHMLSL